MQQFLKLLITKPINNQNKNLPIIVDKWGKICYCFYIEREENYE